jgi:beta-lactamase regulating signal transducer with metallopeptidase domain
VKGLETLFSNPLLHALGWTLVHAVWQGAFVGFALSAVLRSLRGQGPNLRYVAACSALILMLVLPVVTFWRLTTSSQYQDVDEMMIRTPSSGDVPSSSGQVSQMTASSKDVPPLHQYSFQRRLLTEQLERLLPWLSLAWLLGVLALTARVAGGMIYTRRLVRRHTRLLECYWCESLKQISKQLRLAKTVRLLESKLVHVPTTVGWLRPVILLPGSVLTGLTPQQLELILAHELAHIRRHDYLVNLFQVVVETLLFYHPAVWWISKQVRNERELACDDLAVTVCGDPIAYARALAKVERLRRDTNVLAMAASGGTLSQRVRRLIDSSQNSRRGSSPFVACIIVSAIFISIASVQNVLSKRTQPSRTVVESQGSHDAILTDHSQVPAMGSTQQLISNDDISGEDPEVRRIALAALGKRDGAVIVMDPRTGRVYTIVNQEWAVRQSWKPASIIKLVTAAAAVTEKTIQPSELLRLSSKSRLDLTEALAISSNSYFNFVGEAVGPERIIDYARQFGLGEQTGINYPGESVGRLPESTVGIDVSHFGATGEGIEATPIQLATLVSAVANGGLLITPRVPRQSPESNESQSNESQAQIRRRINIPREVLDRLMAGMIAAANHGTAVGASDSEQIVAGKTGTVLDKTANIGLFASCAPANDPRFVVVVVTRGQNESGPAAANVAGTIYRALNSRL